MTIKLMEGALRLPLETPPIQRMPTEGRNTVLAPIVSGSWFRADVGMMAFNRGEQLSNPLSSQTAPPAAARGHRRQGLKLSLEDPALR